MPTPIRVLIVEDSEEDAALLVHELSRSGYDVAFERVDTPEAMSGALEGQTWDIVIADYVMPRFSGLAALALLKDKGLDLPFIVVSGKIGEETAVQTMKAGASDYLTKGNLARLIPAIQRELREAMIRQERRQMAAQLQRAQRLEMAGRIAGQVAHDLNNLLSPLLGYAQIIKKQLPADHVAIRFCDIMISAAQQMAAINEELLTLARRGVFEQEPVNINLLVQQVLGQIPRIPPSLTVELDFAAELLPVMGSESQLSRVVSNLLSNARDAMQDAGSLRIHTESVYIDSPTGGYHRIEVGEYVRLDVSDTGCGIPLDMRDKIFDPFFTTKRGDQRRGSGLGLSVVQAIVNDHQGHVDLESELGKGTTFRVYLPVCRDAVRESASGEARGGTEHILVVDDDEMQRDLEKELLQPLGYNVDVVTSGEEAVAYLQERSADLLVLDMVMVGGIDGAETYRRALELRPRQKAVIVSGFAESAQVLKAKDLGVGAYLRKPVTLEKLARAIREELDRK